MKKLITILIALTAIVPLSRASLYRTYQVEEGLSHNSVWAVMQDSRGFLWFGTNDGLNRFDGLTFTVYRRVEGDTLSLGNNFIHCLKESQDGKILVGTKEGLYSYDPMKDRFSHIKLSGKPFGEDKTSIHSIEIDKKGQIWIGCYGQGVYQLSPQMKILKHFAGKSLPSQYITAMSLDGAGNLWIGTDNKGMFRLDPKTGKISSQVLANANIQSIFRQNNNTIWIGTSSDGLYHYDPLKNSLSHVTLSDSGSPVRDVKAITQLNPGELVMGSENGLLNLSCSDEKLTPYHNLNSYDNLPDKSIFAITLDSEGGLWLGTYFHGVCYWSPSINAFDYYSFGHHDSSNHNVLRQFATTNDGKILVTSLNNGLSVFDPSTGHLKEMQTAGLSKNIQTVLTIDNEIWTSNYDKGIIVLSYPGGGVSRTYTVANGLPSNTINTLLRASNGNIYVGTSHGAAVFNGTSFSVLDGLQGASVMGIIEDFNGNIWFATHFHGLFKMTPNGKVVNFKHITGNDSSLPGNNINTIYLDSTGKIWVGTEGEGLAMFNPSTGKFEKRITESNGLPSDIIYSIQEDDNNCLWISTARGLVKYNKDTNAIQNFRYLEKLLKFQYSHNSSLKLSHNGRLYFGGSGGFVTFNPTQIRNNEFVPPVHIVAYTVDGKRRTDFMDISEAIILEASESTLGIDVACLSYLAPDQNKIAYRLKGYDDEWKYLEGSARHIEYMNLPWGDYTLEIKGANNDGKWSEPLTKKITVNRPLLMSNAMLVVYIILLIFGAYAIKERVTTLQRRKMVKFSHAKEKELYEAKIGFFTNIAHEIRTPLSLISAPLESILSSGDGNDKTRHNLEVMQKNVKRLLELINQLLDFRKVEAQLMHLNFHKCNVSDIIFDIVNRYDEFANLHRIKLDTKDINSDIECVIDAEAFEKIVGNLMSNAVKYADKRIKISMKIDEGHNKLRLEVSDDGPGIKEKDMDKLFESFYRVDDHGKHPGSGLGLPLARSLAQMHSGSLTVESTYGHGSKFILEIPTDLEEGSEVIGDGADDIRVGMNDEEIADKGSVKPIVLVVEDNEQLRDFIAENLEVTYKVLTASNGIDALKELENHMVDIVVSDIMMPDMDGIELCRVIRNTPEYSHLPIIILSAKTDVDTKVEGLNIGANAYLEKPFSIEQLKAQIKSILENKSRLHKALISSPLDYYKNHRSEDDAKESENAAFIEKLNGMILDNMTNPNFTIEHIAQEFCMSRSSFHKRIKGITGETPNDYIRIVKLTKSAELLASGKYQIVEVCYMVGFNTPSYFSKCFSKHFGKLPKEYINDLNNNNNKTQN